MYRFSEVVSEKFECKECSGVVSEYNRLTNSYSSAKPVSVFSGGGMWYLTSPE